MIHQIKVMMLYITNLNNLIGANCTNWGSSVSTPGGETVTIGDIEYK